MGIIECFLLAVGLSMDAFAVAICKGLCLRKYAVRYSAITGVWFGAFQALMPLIGYFLGSRFAQYIESFDHWIAFVLLAVIGGNMLREAHGNDGSCEACETDEARPFSARKMLPMAIATSIDALAVGLTFAFLEVEILPAIILIGCTTFVIAALGVRIGFLAGTRFSAKAELLGGVILIAIGGKILVQHLFPKG